jgi:hypothetical protein
MSPKATDDDTASLKRLAGRGWQTRDGRFTIETASGTWSVVDEERTDDLGLPLVRGPFRSLTEAKAAIEEARTSEPARSTLANRPPAKVATAASPGPAPRTKSTPSKPSKPSKPEEPEEPRWIAELEPADRRRATRLIARLGELGVRDPEGIARKDVAGGVPTVARVAVADRLAELLDDTDPATVKLVTKLLDVLGEGRDEGLDVRWRLVDADGRPVGVSADDVAAARKRAEAARR